MSEVDVDIAHFAAIRIAEIRAHRTALQARAGELEAQCIEFRETTKAQIGDIDEQILKTRVQTREIKQSAIATSGMLGKLTWTYMGLVDHGNAVGLECNDQTPLTDEERSLLPASHCKFPLDADGYVWITLMGSLFDPPASRRLHISISFRNDLDTACRLIKRLGMTIVADGIDDAINRSNRLTESLTAMRRRARIVPSDGNPAPENS